MGSGTTMTTSPRNSLGFCAPGRAWIAKSRLAETGASLCSSTCAGRLVSRRRVVTAATDSEKDYDMKLRLREEMEAPFRKVRMTVYVASAASAAIGGFVAGSRVIAALTGISGVQPLNETLPNVAVDLGVIGAAAFLFNREVKAGEKRLQRLRRQDMVGFCNIEISTGKVIKVADLKGSRRVLIISGDFDTVKAVMDSGYKHMEALRERDLVVIPLSFTAKTSNKDLAKNWTGAGIATPIQLDSWREWAEVEAKRAKAKSVDDGCFITIIRKDGKVGGRSAQPLMWEKLIADLDKLPSADRFGTP